MLTKEQIEIIQKEYEQGSTYREITGKYNISTTLAASILRGRRSGSDAAKLSVSRGRKIWSEESRLKLSESAKKTIKSGNKIWTKPEKEFVQILRSHNIGVRFPDYMCETLGVVSDKDASVYAQYPVQRYVCDFVHLESKTIFRVNGDFWHANPLLYSGELTKIQKFNCTRDELAKNTSRRMDGLL
jgi:transposase